MTRLTRPVAVAVALAALMAASAVALPLLGVGLGPISVDDPDADGGERALTDDEPDDIEATDGVDTADGSDLELIELASPSTLSGPVEDSNGADEGPSVASVDSEPTAQLQDDREAALEEGIDEGIELAEAQGVEVTGEQREAALAGAAEFVAQYEDADDEQVRESAKGAVHGTLLATQDANVTAIQHAVGGAVDGALAQHATVEASQMGSAAWGGTHGALAQEQRVTVEQIQVATRGAAAGAASEAAASDIEHEPTVQEAAQGAAYGVLSQYQKLTVEQRQTVSLEHVQHAAAGAGAGALEGTTEAALAEDQRIDVEAEQYQRVDVKQVQKAATGAAKGALVQRQDVTIEQTQVAARGGATGATKAVQSVPLEQVQRVTITGLQDASFGAAKGAIVQSQAATVEQIQYAADGAAHGTLVQRQDVTASQKQYAATGAAKGAVESAVQHQVVEVDQIQAAAFGAGEGSVVQKQIVEVGQVQQLAMGSASGALAQHQEATVEQLQLAASSASQETARAVQYQRISVTQLQVLTQETAADATAYAVAEGLDREDRPALIQYVEIEVVQRIEQVEELEGEATVVFADQDSDGEQVTIDAVNLSEGGFVAVYDDVAVDADPDAVLGASDYLESGTHENVTVELDDSLEESRALLAVVHHETTDDGTFRYVETDGEEDEPYVTEGGAPVVDGAFVTVEEEPVPEPEPEPEADLSVADQTGDGETLTIDRANATVEYVVTTEYDGVRVDSETFPADESIENRSLALEPPIEDDSTVTVSVRDAADDDALASESIAYELEDEPDPEPEPPEPTPDANLTVSDQRGDGESVTITEANASVDYTIAVADEATETLVETDPFPADEGLENESIDLDEPLETDATLEATVVDAADGESLANATFEYTVDEEFAAEFVGCSRVEVSDSFEAGASIGASTGFYTAGGFGNTISEDFVTVGEDVEAPFTGTIVFEVDPTQDGVTESAEDEVVVAVGDYGDYGTTITGISSPEAFPFAQIDHPNPDAEACIEETRPALPSLFVEETTVADEDWDGDWNDPPTIEVTFGYDNPNDASVFVASDLEGTTDDEPIDELEAGEGSFVVEWTPESEDERLAWAVDMTIYDYDEELTAETEPAGEIVDEIVPDEEPARFAIDALETNSPVQQGADLEVDATIANEGEQAGTQDVELTLGEPPVDATDLELEAGETETVTLTATTDDLEVGEYVATVSTANESLETTVTIEEPDLVGEETDDEIATGEEPGVDDGAEDSETDDDGDDAIAPDSPITADEPGDAGNEPAIGTA